MAREQVLNSLRSRLTEAREELIRADSKASMLLSSEGVVAGVLLAAVIVGDWSPTLLPGCLLALWWLAVVAGLGSLVSLAIGIYPRTRAVRKNQVNGPAYYGDMPGTVGQEELTEKDRVRDQLAQVSRIVRIKYRTIKVALWLFGAAIAGLLLVALLDLV